MDLCHHAQLCEAPRERPTLMGGPGRGQVMLSFPVEKRPLPGIGHRHPWAQSAQMLLMRSGDIAQNPGPSDDYQLDPPLLPYIVRTLGCPPPWVDAFAAAHNALLPQFWDERRDAFQQSWLSERGPIWANPPYTLQTFTRVRCKVLSEGAHVILLCPEWDDVTCLFHVIARRSVLLPLGSTFRYQGRALLPPPRWRIRAFLLCVPPPGPWPFPAPGESTGVDERPPQRITSLLPNRSTPYTGRGSLLTCGDVPPNPGPSSGPAGGRGRNDPMAIMLRDLERWYLSDWFDGESAPWVENGPCGPTTQNARSNWMEWRCTACGTRMTTCSFLLHRRHIRQCLALHRLTGRGEALKTCGDIQQNPGPRSGRGEALLTCGDVEANPGPDPPQLGPGMSSGCSQALGAMQMDGEDGDDDLGLGPEVPLDPLAAEDDTVYVDEDFARQLRPTLHGAQSSDSSQMVLDAQSVDAVGATSQPVSNSSTSVDIDGAPMDIAHATTLLMPPLMTPAQMADSIRFFGMRPLSQHLIAPTDILTMLGARIPTIRHVPNAAQRDVSQALAGVIQAYCSDRGPATLWQMLAFAKMILRPAPGKKEVPSEQLVVLLRHRISRLQKGDLHGLWGEACSQFPQTANGVTDRAQPRRQGSTEGPLSPQQLDRVRQLLSEGAAKKALQLLNSAGTHDPNDVKVWARLEELHPDQKQALPAGMPTALPPMLGDDAPEFWEPKLSDAIVHFPRGSAPGPSGLRPGHLQDAMKRKGAGAGLLSALARLTQAWVHGLLPADHAPALCAANLTPLRKPDGGVRPVAVGDTLRRLVGKALLATNVAKQQVSSLAPLQTGIGIKGAAESVAMGCQSMVDHLAKQTGWVMLKLDMANAFNTVSRKDVLQGALELCPAAFNFLRFAYSERAPLFTGGKLLWSKEGTHQGCPLGPLGFALGIHPVLLELARTPGVKWQSWYLDDAILLGDAQHIAAALLEVQERMALRGLRLNLNKCELWGPGVSNWTGPEVKKIDWEPTSGLVVLGIPINFPGSTAFAERFWAELLAKLQAATEHLAARQIGSQSMHHLLRKCLDGCKVTHLLRSTDCYRCAPVHECDAIIFGALEDLIGCQLTPSQRQQATLPLKVGGCGVRGASRIRPAARIAALATFYTGGAAAVGIPDWARAPRSEWLSPVLEDLRTTLGANFDPVTSWLGRIDLIGGASPDQRKQKWWSEALGKKTMIMLLDGASPRDQTRLLEQANGIGHAFMCVPPSRPLHTFIPSDEYRLAMKWWLGIALIEDRQGLRCPGCQRVVDRYGDHLLCCLRNNHSQKHAAVQEAIVSCLVECGQAVRKEEPLPAEAQPIGDDGKPKHLRAADIFLPAWDAGRDVAIDLTISHGWGLSEQARGSVGELVSRERWRTFLCKREEDKHAKYDAACARANPPWSFRAMAFGTWGGVGPEGIKTLSRILQRSAGWLEGDMRASRQEELRYFVGLTLMRQVWELLARKNFL